MISKKLLRAYQLCLVHFISFCCSIFILVIYSFYSISLGNPVKVRVKKDVRIGLDSYYFYLINNKPIVNGNKVQIANKLNNSNEDLKYFNNNSLNHYKKDSSRKVVFDKVFFDIEAFCTMTNKFYEIGIRNIEFNSCIIMTNNSYNGDCFRFIGYTFDEVSIRDCAFINPTGFNLSTNFLTISNCNFYKEVSYTGNINNLVLSFNKYYDGCNFNYIGTTKVLELVRNHYLKFLTLTNVNVDILYMFYNKIDSIYVKDLKISSEIKFDFFSPDDIKNIQDYFTGSNMQRIKGIKSFLQNIYISSGSTLEYVYSGSIYNAMTYISDSLGLNILTLENIWLVPIRRNISDNGYTGGQLGIGDFEVYNENLTNSYNICIQSINNNNSLILKTKSKIVKRLEYMQVQSEIKKLRSISFDNISEVGFSYFQSKLYLLWLLFLKLVLNNGYNGEVNFTFVCFGLILIFSLIYASNNRFELNMFAVNDEFNVKEIYSDKTRLIYEKEFGDIFLQYLRCLWFSLVVFISPTFNKKYFKSSNNLQIFIITEWFLGLFMIIIFLIYVASDYPFVEKIVGF